VQAVLEAIKRIGLDNLIGSKRSRERDLVLAMIVCRISDCTDQGGDVFFMMP
jgi:hypothetical protein